MRRQTAAAALVLAVIVIAACLGTQYRTAHTSTTSTAGVPTVTVDAGHGGFDGGAVAADGTMEKDINLAVSAALADALRLCGVRVVMTRTQDAALCEEDGLSVREKKVADMKARLALYEQADLNISVHQNSFGGTRYDGTQVFYSTNHTASETVAKAVRERVIQQLQPENTRALKSGNRDIYLLYKTTRPTVLVECGFLSNAQELERLKTPTYQRQMALCIACGAVSALGKEAVA